MDLDPGAQLAAGSRRILAALRRTGPRSRAELQRMLGFSRVTIAGWVQPLLEQGIIIEQGAVPSRGRPTSRLAFNPSHGLLAVEAMETTRAGTSITDLDGTVLAAAPSPARLANGPETSLAATAGSIRSLAERSGIPLERLLGVGISLPGPVDPATQRPSEPPVMPGWDGYDVAGALSDAFGIPAAVENDANAMALGVQRREFPRSPSLLLIKCGTGIGAGIVLDGAMYGGVDGGAGDIGHIRVVRSGGKVCRCGATGCLATIASGRAVATELAERGYDAEAGHDVRRLLDEGDAAATELVRAAGREIGTVAAGLVALMNPADVVLAGDLASSSLLGGFRESLYALTLPRATRHLAVSVSEGPDAATHGIAQILSDRLFGLAAVEA